MFMCFESVCPYTLLCMIISSFYNTSAIKVSRAVLYFSPQVWWWCNGTVWACHKSWLCYIVSYLLYCICVLYTQM